MSSEILCVVIGVATLCVVLFCVFERAAVVAPLSRARNSIETAVYELQDMFPPQAWTELCDEIHRLPPSYVDGARTPAEVVSFLHGRIESLEYDLKDAREIYSKATGRELELSRERTARMIDEIFGPLAGGSDAKAQDVEAEGSLSVVDEPEQEAP